MNNIIKTEYKNIKPFVLNVLRALGLTEKNFIVLQICALVHSNLNDRGTHVSFNAIKTYITTPLKDVVDVTGKVTKEGLESIFNGLLSKNAFTIDEKEDFFKLIDLAMEVTYVASKYLPVEFHKEMKAKYDWFLHFYYKCKQNFSYYYNSNKGTGKWYANNYKEHQTASCGTVYILNRYGNSKQHRALETFEKLYGINTNTKLFKYYKDLGVKGLSWKKNIWRMIGVDLPGDKSFTRTIYQPKKVVFALDLNVMFIIKSLDAYVKAQSSALKKLCAKQGWSEDKYLHEQYKMKLCVASGEHCDIDTGIKYTLKGIRSSETNKVKPYMTFNTLNQYLKYIKSCVKRGLNTEVKLVWTLDDAMHSVDFKFNETPEYDVYNSDHTHGGD